jgi:hypothetical protein
LLLHAFPYIFYSKTFTYLKLASVLFGRQLKIKFTSVVAGAHMRVAVFEIGGPMNLNLNLYYVMHLLGF